MGLLGDHEQNEKADSTNLARDAGAHEIVAPPTIGVTWSRHDEKPCEQRQDNRR